MITFIDDGGVSYFSQVIADLQFDGTDGSTTFTDASGKAWTAAGDAQIDTSDYYSGSGALLLDGTGDYISTPSDAGFTLNSGDVRIAAAIKISSFASGIRRTICSRRGSGIDGEYIFYVSDTGFLRCVGWDGSSSILMDVQSAAGAISANAWTEVAFERIGTSLKLYKNNVEVASATQTGYPSSVGNTFRIGSEQRNAQHLFAGWIDRFQFLKH